MIHLEDEFGDIIRKARNGHRLTTEEVARRTGISEHDIVRMERYELKPKREEVEKLAKALDLHPEKLIAIALEGWVPDPWNPNLDPRLDIVPIDIPIGRSYSSRSYLLVERETQQAAAVDAGVNAEKIIEHLENLKVDLRLILITHGHSDHIGGVLQLRTKTSAQVYAGADEPIPPQIGGCVRLNTGNTVTLGKTTIQAIQTSGHTAGSTCYLTGKSLFSGDTLFAGSVGGANYSYNSILQSIRKKILTLDPDVQIFPGHGPVTTVSQERKHNPFFDF